MPFDVTLYTKDHGNLEYVGQFSEKKPAGISGKSFLKVRDKLSKSAEKNEQWSQMVLAAGGRWTDKPRNAGGKPVDPASVLIRVS